MRGLEVKATSEQLFKYALYRNYKPPCSSITHALKRSPVQYPGDSGGPHRGIQQGR